MKKSTNFLVRNVGVILVALLPLAWYNLACVRKPSAPVLGVETEASFQYEQFMELIYRTPSEPNRWHIESKVTSNDSRQMEVLPMYLYSEIESNKTNTFENSNIACPKSFSNAFSAASQNGLTIAPTDLGGEIENGSVFLCAR